MNAIDNALARLAPIDLPSLLSAAELQRRYDSKYLLTEAAVAQVVTALGPEWRVLEIDGNRSTRYTSTYFDDDRLGLFHDHLQGRRLRYKVRTRRYGEAAAEMLEIKLKSGRGATDKRRVQRIGTSPTLTVAEREWLERAITDTYGDRPVPVLAPSLGLRYERRTLFNPSALERVTIDTDLSAEADGPHADPIGAAVVVEVKSAHWLGPTVRLLRARGLRPVSFSKYCTAVAALHPEVNQHMRKAALREFALGT